MRVVIEIRNSSGSLTDFPDVFCDAHARKYLALHYPHAKWPEPWQHQQGTWNRARTEQVIVRVVKDDPGVTNKVPCLWCSSQPVGTSASDPQA